MTLNLCDRAIVAPLLEAALTRCSSQPIVQTSIALNSKAMTISAAAFDQIRDYIYRTAGINIGADKSAMVISRLWRRLELVNCADFEAYFAFVSSPLGGAERSCMLDLLTTNETYFFREPAHFTFLRDKILPHFSRKKIKVWCAAAATGEEPYSLAMVLQDRQGAAWELLASDISSAVLNHARKGIYGLERLDALPAHYLKRFCLRGVDECSGKMAIAKTLLPNIRFEHHNLMQPLPSQELFDVIFLRNVLIYFDQATKQKVIEHILQRLRPGGWLVVGHCEYIQGFKAEMSSVAPSVYCKRETVPAI